MNVIKKVSWLVFIVLFMAGSFFLLKSHYEEHKYDINKVPARKTTDYSSILRGVFESKNWDGLQISEKFKNKYKTKYDITDKAGRFVSYDNGDAKENGEDLIVISYIEQPFFDFVDLNNTTIDMYFRYKIDENKLLDDVELVRIEKTDSLTGKLIE